MTFKKYLFSIMILFALLGSSVCVLTPMSYIEACPFDDQDGDGDDCDYSAGENMFNCPDDCKPAGIPDKSIEDAIEDTVLWILGLAVAVSIVAMIYGGLTYVTSSGNTEQAATSKKIFKYALLGTAIAGSSYVILQLLDDIIG